MELLHNIALFILDAVGCGGYSGIFALMSLESSFFPFPSEVVIPPAAFLAAHGEMNIYLVILVGTAGSLLGAWINYYISMTWGTPLLLKFGKYIGLKQSTLERANSMFRKHGEISTFIGRLLPTIRQYISIPAGISRMNPISFSIFTVAGSGIWVSILAFVGYTVGNNPKAVKRFIYEDYMYLIFFSITIIILYILIRRMYDRRF